jgi:hypothetical protein
MDYEEQRKQELEEQATILRMAGWEWRGNGNKSRDPYTKRMRPVTDYWNKPLSHDAHERTVWRTRQQALNEVRAAQ